MTTHRFTALDGLRGICAVMVLLYHTFLHGKFNPVFHGYLSVDVFFALSGFVLAYAFGDRLDAGMRAGDFMRARIRRLGPIVWFAAAFSLAACLLTEWLGVPGGVSFSALMLAAIQSAFLVPMTGSSGIDAFPLNGPIWSLFAEFWLNAGLALVASRLRISSLLAIIAVGWVFVITYAFQSRAADFGASQSTILYSVLRAAPTFASGVLIFRLWRMGVLSKLPAINPMPVFAGWIAVCLAPDLGPAFDLVQMLVVAPLIVALLARSGSTAPGWTLWLGRISFPLYATHMVILSAGHRLAHGHLPGWALFVLPAAAILLADALARWYEPAFRNAQSRFAGSKVLNAAA